jgi:DNA-binding transcriptional LysR family regulator
MNLNQLQYVKKIAETGNFSKAAENCFVTQPSLSNAVAQLEEEIGGRLFFRTTHGVMLTPLGERLLPLIETLLETKDELVKTAQNYVNPEHKLIKLGFCPSINVNLLANALEPFKKSNPDVEIILKECFVGDLSERLANYKIDFAFMPEGFKMNNTGKSFFYDEELYYLPRETELLVNNSETTICLEEIAGETFAIAGEGCGLVGALRELFNSRNLAFNEYSGQALSYSVLEDWANLGIGATILPKSKISKKNKNARQLFLAIEKPAKIVFETIWNKTAPQSETYKLFLRYFKKNVPTFIKGLKPINAV